MSRDTSEIIAELKMSLAKRGTFGMANLGRFFKVNDSDRSGSFDLTEFEKILCHNGIFLKRQELTQLFRAFDVDKSGSLRYEEFMRAVVGTLNERRQKLVDQAFGLLDADGSGSLTIKDIAAKFDASQAAEVKSGKKTKEEVMHEFFSTLTAKGSNDAADGVITKEEFYEYFAEIGACIPDDDYFVLMMERSWHITEGKFTADVSTAEIERIKQLLIEKIRQKTTGAQSEGLTVLRVFRFFDLDNSGTVSFTEFVFTLERFGIVVDEKVSRALFDQVDISNSGRLSYDEFVSSLFGGSKSQDEYKGR